MALIIDGERIDDEILEQEFSSIKAHFEQISGNIICCERDDEFREYARQNVITRALLMQEARRKDPPVSSAEIDSALKQWQEQEAEGGGAMPPQEMDDEQRRLLREEAEQKLKIEHIIKQLEAELPAPTPEDHQAFYRDHIDLFTTEPKVRASHIIKHFPRGEDKPAAFEHMRDLRRQLLAGATFEPLAREHSDRVKELEAARAEGEEADADAGDGIDLGWFSYHEMMEEFAVIALSMNVSEISPVFLTHYGYHLVQVTDRQDAAPRPFNEVEEEVKRQLAQDRREQAVRDFVAMREKQITIEQVEEEIS